MVTLVWSEKHTRVNFADIHRLRTSPPQPKASRVTARLRRALEVRVAALEAEQATAAGEFEALYERGDTILRQMEERQGRLRVFRDLLLNKLGSP
jgi:predicted nuclease with RNAse H fold